MSADRDPKRPGVLMVSFAFFSRPGAGHVRTRKFAKFLPGFGWQPSVLTEGRRSPAAEPAQSDEEAGVNLLEVPFHDLFMAIKELLGLDRRRDAAAQVDEWPSASALSRLRAKATRKAIRVAKDWLAFPDAKITWAPHAIWRGYRAAGRSDYSLIYSTYPPGTNHIVAWALKLLTGLPWVADYRDLWSQDEFLDRSRARRKVERLLEKRIVSRADALVTVSAPYADMLRRLHPGKRITVITNGYDPDERPDPAEPVGSRLLMTYTGNLYNMRCDPRPVLSTLERLIDDGELKESEILVRFYSQWDPAFERLREEMKHKDIVELNGMVPREQALVRQAESSVLLLVAFDEPQASIWHTSKIFEYMGAGRPILAWAPRGGEVARLISETRTGAAPATESELEQVLREWVRAFRETGSVPYAPDAEELARYSRRELAGELARVMESVLGERR